MLKKHVNNLHKAFNLQGRFVSSTVVQVFQGVVKESADQFCFFVVFVTLWSSVSLAICTDLTEKVTSLSAVVSKLDSADDKLLEKIKLAFAENQENCKANQTCFVTEGQVFANSKTPKNILLFRGESFLSPTPATSSAVRLALVDSVFCDTAETKADLLLDSIRSSMASLTAFGVVPNSSDSIDSSLIYDPKLRTWFKNVGSQSMPNLQLLTRTESSFSVSEAMINAARILNAGHIDGQVFLISSSGSLRSGMDPYASLSANINIALQFANPKYLTKGRILIFSIDPTEVPNAVNCQSWPNRLGDIVNISLCSAGEVYPLEMEFDFGLIADSNKLKASVLYDGSVKPDLAFVPTEDK